MDLLAEVAREPARDHGHAPTRSSPKITRRASCAQGRASCGDTCPVTEDEVEAARAAAVAHPDEGSAHRSSMGLLTALSLSFNNLMTKKGRTIMTAFAGSIGIIGIAAILALSNGVNGYIAKVEQDTLSSYPLTIARQSYDLTSMMTGDAGTPEEEVSGDGVDGSEAPSADADGGRKVDPEGAYSDIHDALRYVREREIQRYGEFQGLFG